MAPIPVGVQRLAAQLAQRMPWLARDRHIGALARLLHRHQLNSDTGWTAELLLRALELHNRTTRRVVPDPVNQRNPLGYLNWLLTAADLDQATPPVASARRPMPSWQHEDAERARLLAGEDPALRAAIIAQIRADVAAERAARPAPIHDRAVATARSQTVRAAVHLNVAGGSGASAGPSSTVPR